MKYTEYSNRNTETYTEIYFMLIQNRIFESIINNEVKKTEKIKNKNEPGRLINKVNIYSGTKL